jgi:hypothetical protein
MINLSPADINNIYTISLDNKYEGIDLQDIQNIKNTQPISNLDNLFNFKLRSLQELNDTKEILRTQKNLITPYNCIKY